MKKKLLTILLAVVAMLSICIGISACDDKSVSSPDDNSQTEQPDDSHNGNQNNGDSQEQHKHVVGAWVEEIPAQCEEEGVLGHFECTTCHKYFDANMSELNTLTIPKLDHAWDNGKITKEATCIEPGVKTFTCQRDEKHQKTEVIQIDPKNHDYGDWIVQTDATCEAPGELGHYQCSFCHHYFDNELKEISDLTIRALGHAWDNGIVTSEPTCSQQGEKYFTCTRDNSHHKTEKIAIDQDAHKWNDGEVTKPATCSAEGIKTYTCQYDKEHTRIETIEIDKDAHSYEDWVPQIDAECEKEGVLGHFRCEYCQLYFDIEHQPLDDLQIVPKGHLYMSQILSFGCEVGKFELKICERCQKSSCDRIEIPKAHSGVGICADCGLDFWEAYKNYFENNGVYSSIDDQYSISKFFYYSGNDFHCTWCYSNDNVITWLIDAYNGSTKQYTVTITIKPNSTICNWNLQIYISTTQTMRGTFDARNITEDIDMLPIDYCSPALNTPSYKQTFGGLAASLTGILLLYTRTNFMENPEGFNIEGFGFVNFGKPYVFHDFVVKSYSIPTSTQKGEIEFYCGLCNTTKKYQYEWDVQPSTEHIHQFGEWVEEIPATCDDEGRVGYHQCETCKKYYDADNQEITDFSIPALKHDWGTGVVTKKATCTEEGTIEYTCKHDPNHKYTEQISIDQDAHTFGQWVDKVDADCENAGHVKFPTRLFPHCSMNGMRAL